VYGYFLASSELWNWLNPGAGVHLASLDQGDDTVEFGIGVRRINYVGLSDLPLDGAYERS
jgi:hypothetical protein